MTFRYISVRDNLYGLDNSDNFWNPFLYPENRYISIPIEQILDIFIKYKKIKKQKLEILPKSVDKPIIIPSKLQEPVKLINISDFINNYNNFMETVIYIYNNVAKEYNKIFKSTFKILKYDPLDVGDGMFVYNDQLINLEMNLKKYVDKSYQLITSIMNPLDLEKFRISKILKK